MDEITIEFLLLGTVIGVLLLSMVLQFLTIRYLKTVQKKLTMLLPEGSGSSTTRTDSYFPQPVTVRKDIGPLLRRHSSIDESLRALCDLYRLESITVATKDGLVAASTSKEAQAEAAIMSERFNRGEVVGEAGVRLFRIDHKTSVMIGIIRTSEGLDDEKLGFIRENVNKILNHWL